MEPIHAESKGTTCGDAKRQNHLHAASYIQGVETCPIWSYSSQLRTSYYLVLPSMTVSEQSNAALKSMSQWFTQRIVAWCRGRVCNFARRRHLNHVARLPVCLTEARNSSLTLLIQAWRPWSNLIHGCLSTAQWHTIWPSQMTLNSCSMKTVFYAIKTRDVDRVRCLSLQDIRSSNEPGDSPTKAQLGCLNSGSRRHHMPRGDIAVAVVYIKFVKFTCFGKQWDV